MEFLQRVKVKQFTTTRGGALELLTNRYPEDIYTVIGVHALTGLYFVSRKLGVWFKANAQDCVPVEEKPAEPDKPLEAYKLTWPDGTNEWVAARDEDEAKAVLQNYTNIGDKDLAELTLTREDLRRAFFDPLSKKSVRFGAYLKTVSKAGYIASDIEEG